MSSAPKNARYRARSAGAAESFTIGREAFAKISAVEGIRLSAEVEEAFREFDRKGLSAEERRREIMNRYGRKPA